MKQYLKLKFYNNKFFKSILLVSGGTALAQILNVLTSPLITRIYSPEEYGVFTIFTSFLMVFSFSSLKYELAIPIAKKDSEAINIMGLSIATLTTITILISVLLFFKGEQILTAFNAEPIIDYKYFISLGMFFYGLYMILLQWLYRRKNFKKVSSTKITQSTMGNITKVLLGFVGVGPIGLLLGKIINESAGFFSIFNLINKKEKHLFKMLKFREMRRLAKRYINFPLYQAPSACFLHFRNQLPVFFIAPLFGSETVGYYGLANTIIKIPMMLIGQSVMDVFYAEIASLGKDNSKYIRSLTSKLIKKLLIIGVFPFIVLFIGGPFLFSIFFGPEWYEAGIFARILSIYVFASLVLSPVSKIFEVYEKQNYKLLIDVVSFIMVFTLFLFADIFMFGPYLTLLLFSIIMTILYIVTYIIAQIILKNDN